MRLVIRTLALVVISNCVALCGADEIQWERQKLDERFRSEGVAAADVNHDNRMDVLAGDVWYEAPDWTIHEIRPPGEFVAGEGYSTSFANFAYDVNDDGWDDFILVGFPGAEFYWYENPQNKPGHWKEHLIWHSACNESPDFEDVTGDGKPELILGSQPEKQLGYLSLPASDDAADKWAFTPVSAPGEPGQNGSHRFYHGLGIGDFDQDGRNDVLIPHGWYKQPQAAAEDWTFQPWSLSKEGTGNPLPAANIYLDDLDLDGDQDIMMSCAHAFGVWWFENVSTDATPAFEYRVIDESYSQTHALEFVDINGDGTKDLVTGKRFFAHNGHDPGGNEPVVMYWYELHKKQGSAPELIAHEIEAGRDTGVGTQFQVTDMNGDDRPDIVLSNKKGVNVLLQK